MTCEFRSTDEPRPGVVFGGTFGFAEVRYSAIDGKAIFEGDIIIGTVAEMEALAGTREAVVIAPEEFRWPDGLIPFEIEAVPLSKAPPALAAFGEELHMVHLGDSSNAIWHSRSTDRRTWAADLQVSGQLSKAAPALAPFGGELHMVHLGDSSNNIWHSWSSDGRNWSENVRIKDQQSKAAPALVALVELHMVHLGDSTNRVWRSWTDDGRKWAANTHPAPRSRILDAMRHWEERTTIRFVERNADNAKRFPDYVYFHESDGCASAVGRRGGRQETELAVTCSLGNAIHEIGHTVGLWHEQSREDRDSFVRILFENIEDGREHNFDQHVTDGDDVGEYDYGSIMHYPRDAFSTNGPTIIPLIEGASIGQRDGLSRRDIAAVNFLYPG